MMSPSRTTETLETLETLNELLRGELAAVEMYNRALRLVGPESAQRADLEQCQISHENRALRLRSEILELGGEPVSTGEAWGASARLVEGESQLAGPNVAIAALVATERRGLEEYRQSLPRLDFHSRNLVLVDLYPQQVSTDSLMASLTHARF